jgi:hypothetical protein
MSDDRPVVQRHGTRWRRAAAGRTFVVTTPGRSFRMVSSAATTVEAYLDSLPEERRAVVSAVRDVVRRHLPHGYRESMEWGMIGYAIPIERYPDTYNGQPLCYAALAAQKNHYSLYLTGAYGDEGDTEFLRRAFARAGKKLDMGKSCVRFKSIDDLPLPAIGELIASVPPAMFIARYEAARAAPRAAPARKTSTKKSPAKKATTKRSAARRRG